MDKKFENFKTSVNNLVNKKNKNKNYNNNAVAKILGIDTGGNCNQQCDKIIDFQSKRRTNEIIDNILTQHKIIEKNYVIFLHLHYTNYFHQ